MSSIPSFFDPAQPVLHHVTCPGASQTDAATHRMAYWAWGDPTNERILVRVHGLSRQGRDLDTLARSLTQMNEVRNRRMTRPAIFSSLVSPSSSAPANAPSRMMGSSQGAVEASARASATPLAVLKMGEKRG